MRIFFSATPKTLMVRRREAPSRTMRPVVVRAKKDDHDIA
jgi:hypothetical protein